MVLGDMWIKSVLLLLCAFPLTGCETVSSELLIGHWIGLGSDSNQTLHLNDDLKGTWTIKFSESNISKREVTTSKHQDFFIIDARIEGVLVEKMVLSGWQYDNGEAVFGSRFLYHKVDGDLEVFNGIPVSFQRKSSHERERLMRFLTSPVEAQVSETEFQKFVEQLQNTPALQTQDNGTHKLYVSPSWGIVIITSIENPAHPAMLSVTSFPTLENWNTELDSLMLLGRYTGSRSEFLKWREEIGTELREELRTIAPLRETDEKVTEKDGSNQLSPND